MNKENIFHPYNKSNKTHIINDEILKKQTHLIHSFH